MSVAGDGTAAAMDDTASMVAEVQSTTSSTSRSLSETGASGDNSAASSQTGSDLLKRIQALRDTQKALKEQQQKCAVEMKNAVKKQKRQQGKASQLSDTDLLEVLRMHQAKKDGDMSAASGLGQST